MADTKINETLKKLEDIYLAGDFKKYRSELISKKSDLSTGLFHYNLGTLFAKEGNLAAARYNFEKSKLSGFKHPALDRNLRLTEKLITKNVQKESSNILMMQLVGTSSSLFLMASLTLILVLTFMKKKHQISLRLYIILSCIAFAPFLYKKTIIENTYKLAINLKEIKIYEGPSKIYEVINTLSSGHKLIVGKSFGDWVFIESPDEAGGWIKRNELGIL